MLYNINIFIDGEYIDSFTDHFSSFEDAWYAGILQYGISDGSESWVEVELAE